MKHNISIGISMLCTVLFGVQCTSKLETGDTPDCTISVCMTATTNATKAVNSETTTGLATSWKKGDKLYVVAPTDGCLGALTAQENGATVKFSGDITPWTGTQDLQFYFVGNGQTIANSETSFSYDISTQQGTLEYVATKQLMHGSKASVAAGTTSFGTITMSNLNAVAKFDLATNLDESQSLTCAAYSTASLNLATGELTPSSGTIALGTNPSNASAYYMVLIPGSYGLGFSDGTKTEKIFKPLFANRYYCADASGSAIVVKEIRDGELPGEFSVSPTKKVYFSKGNLQYIGSATPAYFKFADNQWDIIGTGQMVSNANVDRDLFGFGTSGYNGKYPYQTIHNESNYASGTINETNYDWGQYNHIMVNSTATSGWRTPTQSEWEYLFNRKVTVNSEQESSYIFCKVNNVNGLIVLPDNWDGSLFNGTGFEGKYGYSTNYTTCTFDESTTPKWSEMQTAGVVFLPACGARSWSSGNTYCISASYVGSRGAYWSSTSSNSNSSYTLWFCAGETKSLVLNGTLTVYIGYGVRLVKDTY